MTYARLICLLLSLGACAFADPAFRTDRLAVIDDVISQAVTDARTPGAVFRAPRTAPSTSFGSYR